MKLKDEAPGAASPGAETDTPRRFCGWNLPQKWLLVILASQLGWAGRGEELEEKMQMVPVGLRNHIVYNCIN